MPLALPLLQCVEAPLQPGGVGCVISEQSDLCLDVITKIVNVDEEESMAKDGYLQNTGNHLPHGRYLPFDDYLSSVVGEEVTDPLQRSSFKSRR